MSILILVEHHNGTLGSATAHVVAAAKEIGGNIDILVAGEHVTAVAESAAKLDNVNKVWVADNAAYAHQLAEHGIGVLKKAFLHHSVDEHALSAMRSIKQSLDPKGILNPGKIFDLPRDVSDFSSNNDLNHYN